MAMLVNFAAAPVAPSPVVRGAVPTMSGSKDLKALATELNPVIGYYDPINLAEWNLYGKGDDATVGFLRHAEIKHGRVAMAAFVGYCVQANGLKFPWEPFTSISATSPPEQWDALPEAAKWQIILFIGFLEVYSEHSFILEKQGQAHYMKGGKPGYFPKLDSLPHPVPLNLFDPFGLSKNASPETKAKGLLKEVNNGRLAMIGIFGFLAENKVPGSVPFGPHLAAYSGNVMAPFEMNYHF
uniref:Chlorophyll a-b binding protein, chloroplastic n=1 Tax=Haptolina brevifila TaxID=156173 RepID=A0A7S2B6W3_9EUKA|mmetsp:Transcript_10174/g.20713  ORF Transcript_10174/g.20713 Transcript_10174/m.20713 type:complete len:240 (+) Transcript_10174:29-748(+)|eukprot:CAMPEP_0174721676 /NCGR_PEP_ID=MMETSP1094-20130205/36857_1 /TAXON_ID=156173 /ORGANISM="Chrysochromulina brevifilum, Strain UTEX LB 985" /LENGTH=239 /DNA_ID=CAMNT_0015922415 /DNA_START=29 /DNA_END=748 /DNA_ORIENTATION=+